MASVKAHGALYEEVAKGGAIYETFRDAVRSSVGEGVAMVLPSGCRAMAMVLRDGMTACEEGFCDRAYRPDGGLVDRATAGAVLTEPGAAAAQALSLARGAVVADDGSVLTLVGRHVVHPRRLDRSSRHRHGGSADDGGRRDRSGRAGACMIRVHPRRGGTAPR